ncbi:MAG: acetyl-CoA carboxylase biotin carboxylase subunit [Acidobacteriota bacterium]
MKKVLIANRGEIAVRIIRALRDMEMSAVAVFSEADRAARHVRLADEAYCIGPPPSSQSYLNMDAILDVAKRSGAEAIHPGYGFLSENAEFAARCAEAGLVFIGPPPAAIQAMGEKTQARRIMAKAGVPVVPGTLEPLRDAEEAAAEAEKVGYPVMLKAAAGGGGKGMRLVHEAKELRGAFRDASSEAVQSFGDGSIYIEKAILKPRHIEMQILADSHGNVVYMGERECSIQRRHQKIVEEAPSPMVGPEMRAAMGEIAVKAARAVGYVNAGTIEFLVDERGQFYFMEMNTRLQVEHAVTEMVTGIDLARAQIRIAAGQKLRLRQEELSIRGSAIECRIYAEDPENHFLPCPGKIEAVRLPEGPGVRVDSSVFTSGEVSLYYDPMVAKVVTWGRDRVIAARSMIRALQEFQIVGIRTNRNFLLQIVSHPEFLEGKLDTGFIPRILGKSEFRSPGPHPVADIAAAIFAYESARRQQPCAGAATTGPSAWRRAIGRG